MQTIAQQYFNANYTNSGDPPPMARIPPSHAPDHDQRQPVRDIVHVTTQQVNTTLLAVGGIPHLNISSSSTVVWGQTKLWVSLVLDNTGSMCEPDSQPCSTDTNANIKINALKSASHNLLAMLQTASANPGDVQVAIVPFAKDVNVGTGNVGASWIDWTDWNTVVPGSAPGSSVGPGSSCPFSNSYGCVSAPGSTSTTSTVPSSGMICPGPHSTSTQDGTNGHYYDGCYNSVLQTKTLTTTAVTASTPTTVKQNCSQTGSAGTNHLHPVRHDGDPTTASTTNNTTTATTNGYSGDSGPTTTEIDRSSTIRWSTAPRSLHRQSRRQQGQCTWTRTIVTTAVATTVTAVGTNFSHTWVVNDHSLWSGCVMDRTQDDDVNDATASATFPAENNPAAASSPR